MRSRPARAVGASTMARWGALLGTLAVAAAAACSTAYDSSEPQTTPTPTPTSDAQVAPDGTPTEDAADAGQPTGPCTAPLTDGWSAPVRLSALRGDANEQYFVDPFVTADGLTLLVVNSVGSPRRVYKATRPSRGAAWSVANVLPGYESGTTIPLYPTTAAPDREVVVGGLYSQADPHALRLVDGGTNWTAEVILPLSRPDQDWFQTLTGDGLMIVYQQARGGTDPYRVLMQSTRTTIGAAWDLTKGIASPPFDGGPGSVDWHYPALTPNGLALFYAVESKPEVPFVVTRPTRQGDFFVGGGVGTEITSLAAQGFMTRVRSITEDGCELYLTSDRDGELDAYVSKRSP